MRTTKTATAFLLSTLLAACGGQLDNGQERHRSNTFTDIPSDNIVPDAPMGPMPLCTVQLEAAPTKLPKLGNQLHVVSDGTRAMVLYREGKLADPSTPRSEQAQVWRVAVGGPIFEREFEIPDMNTGVDSVIYSRFTGKFRVAGISRRMDGSGRWGELGIPLTGAWTPFDGNMMEIGWTHYPVSDSRFGDFVLGTNTSVPQEVRFGEINEVGGFIWKRSITTVAREGCYQVGGAYASGQTVVALFEGKRLGNLGQYDILEVIVAEKGVERARQIVASSPHQQNTSGIYYCGSFELQAIGIFPVGIDTAVVYRDRTGRPPNPTPIKLKYLLSGMEPRLPEGTEVVMPYGSGHLAALAAYHNPINPFDNQVVFYILKTDGTVVVKLVVSKDKVIEPHPDLARPTILMDVPAIGPAGRENFFLAGWVTSDGELKIALLQKVCDGF